LGRQENEMTQVSSKLFVWFAVAVAGFTALLLFNIYQASQLPAVTVPDIVQALLPSITTLLGALAGFMISRHFFLKGLSQQLHDRYYRACARYDQFLDQLRSLRNPEVDALLLDVRSVTDSPEFFLFDSKFLDVADALAAASPKERRQAMAELQTRLKPAKRYKEKRSCPTPGCDGVFELDLLKGQHFRLPCKQCQTRFSVYISQNDNIIFRRIPKRIRRVRFSHFSEDLPEYLARNRVLVAPDDLRLIAKTIVAQYERQPTLSYYGLKRVLGSDQMLRERLTDIDDAARVVDALLRSKHFFIDKNTGLFPGYNKPTAVYATEEHVYLCFVSYISYKLKEDRQVLVNRDVVRKIMDAVVPGGSPTFKDLDDRIKTILENIGSVDRHYFGAVAEDQSAAQPTDAADGLPPAADP